METETRTKNRKKSILRLIISFVLLVAVTLANWGVITGWGDVKIKRINLIGDDGLTYSALLYVPKTATDDTPAPAIYMIHGGSGNARNHESWSVEFARRGYVCMAVDWLGGGNGETYNGVDNTPNIMAFDMGVHRQFVNYLLDMPIVDRDQFITAGHSLGCGSTFTMAKEFGGKAAMLCGGNARAELDGNIQVIFGDAEFTPRTAQLNAFMAALNANGYPTESIDEIKINELYGSFEEGNAMRFMSSPMQRHEAAFFNVNTIGWLLEFADNSLGRTSTIPYDNQVWQQKEVIGLIGIHIFVFFLCALALFLIDDTETFKRIRQPLPRNVGLRGVGMAISYAAAIIFPLVVLLTGAFGIMNLFGSGLAENKIALFSLGHTSKAMTVTVGLSLCGIVMLGVYMATEGKKHNVNLRDLGLTSEGSAGLDWGLIGKALLLSTIVTVVGWTYLALQADVLGTELYCIIFSMKEIPLIKLYYYIPYIVVWMLCFIVTSVSLNVERRLPSTGNEKLDTAIAMIVNGLMNCIVVIAVISIQNYFQVRTGGTGEYIFQNWGMEINRLWGMPTGMALAGMGQTYMYRKTGNIWTGAFLMAYVCAIMACSGGTSMTAHIQTDF